jgi:putative ABC transport system substrate-binding protein
MKRREFITLLGGSAAAWPLAARAQQRDRIRRVGVLISTAEHDPESQRRLAALVGGLRELGWAEGHELHIDLRYAAGDAERMRRNAEEIVALAPDVIVVQSSPFMAALWQVNRTIPTVIAQVGDPVSAGYAKSLSHPGGNVTGFMTFELEIGGKWLQILKEVAPALTRALVLFDPRSPSNVAYWRSAQAVSAAIGMTPVEGAVREPVGIERAIGAFARERGGGLIVLPSPVIGANRERVIALAAQHRLPAVYAFRFFAESGGLLSYGVDNADLLRRAAGYVDRILKGERPADLPVQAPTKYELVINLKTAKALGIEVPPALLARADEVIE